MKLRRLGSSALAVLALTSAGLSADQSPPAKLQFVGDHWTAWQPPAPPEGAEVHVVQDGDTLWDLAERFYGDPYLWPQLWERNRWILDAHWIYPGDPLVIGVQVTDLEELEEAVTRMGEAEAAEEEPSLALKRGLSPPVPLGSEDDIYCSGFVSDLAESFPFRIIGSEFESLTPGLLSRPGRRSSDYGGMTATKLDLSTGDIVYVDGGQAAGLSPGTLFTVIKAAQEVRRPGEHKLVGRFYSYRGRIQILSVQEESAIAEIVHSCHPIAVGDVLREFVPEPVPLARRSGLLPVTDPARSEQLEGGPMIILSSEGVVSLGQGNTVFIDRGARDDLRPGDIFTIYRETLKGQPLMVIGELAVLSVGEAASLAKILESRYTIRVGDRLDPKPN